MYMSTEDETILHVCQEKTEDFLKAVKMPLKGIKSFVSLILRFLPPFEEGVTF